jgi:drug/metabolite transporter (DMT)-like permease
MAACLGAGMLKKIFLDNSTGSNSSVLLYNALGGAISALVLLMWGGFGECSRYTLLLGILFGIVVGLQGIVMILAFKCGPFSYTNVIASFSTVVTALSGFLFFGEAPLATAQIIGILLMLVSIVLANEKGEDEKSTSALWLTLAVFAFCLTGGIGLMQKIHQSGEYKGELNAYLIIAFITIAVVSVPAILWFMKKEKVKGSEISSKGDNKKSLLLLSMMIMGGVCVAANHKLNLYISGIMPSAVFFPIVNGGGLVLATVASLIVFREKLSPKRWVGLILGTVSVVLVCNPFG